MKLLTTSKLLSETCGVPLLPMLHGEGDARAMRAEMERQNLLSTFTGIVMVHAEPPGTEAEQQKVYAGMIRRARDLMPRAKFGAYHNWRTTISAERVTFPTANLNTPDEVLDRLTALCEYTPKRIYPKVDLRNWHHPSIVAWFTHAIELHVCEIAALGKTLRAKRQLNYNPFPSCVLWDDSDNWPTFVQQYGEVVDGRPLADMMRAECGSTDSETWRKHTLQRWSAVVDALRSALKRTITTRSTEAN